MRDPASLRTAVTELTQSKVAFIVSSGPASRARHMPVPFAISGDPVELGLTASLSRLGGNFAGLMCDAAVRESPHRVTGQGVPGCLKALVCA
jgi:hypothetical protein